MVQYFVEELEVNLEAKSVVDDSTAALWACYGGTVKILQYLCDRLDHHVSQPSHKYTPKVNFLKKDKNGMNAQHYASASGHCGKVGGCCLPRYVMYIYVVTV